MAHNYDSITLEMSSGDILSIEGHYQFRRQNTIKHKVMTLSYKLVDMAHEGLPMERFMREYMDRMFLNGLLKLQSSAVHWRKFVLKTPTRSFSYLLPENIRGKLDRPMKSDVYYQFEIQNASGHRTFLNVYGVPSSIDYPDVKTCEEVLLFPLILEDSHVTIQFCGLQTHSQYPILSIVGRGLKSMPPRKLTTVKVKKKTQRTKTMVKAKS